MLDQFIMDMIYG